MKSTHRMAAGLALAAATTLTWAQATQGVSKGEEPLAVMRRLIAISTLTKRTAPRASRIYKQDAMWVRSKYAKSFGGN